MEQNKTKMEAMLRSILDEILESKLTAILSSILEAKLKVYEESMTFFNTSFETMKVKMDSLENKTKTLAQENDRLRSDSAKMNKEISDLRSSIDDQAQYTRRECLEIRGIPGTAGEDTNEIVKKIGALIEVDISDTDISVSHRIPLSNNGEAGSTPIRHPGKVLSNTISFITLYHLPIEGFRTVSTKLELSWKVIISETLAWDAMVRTIYLSKKA